MVDLKNLAEPRAAGRGSGLRGRLVAAGVVALAALTAGGLWYFRGGSAPAADSLAVLPFVNAASDPDTDYLSDGITDGIINALSPLPQLKVMARSTVFRFKGADPLKAGRELSVRAVLAGQVTKRGDTLVVRSELVDVASGAQLWGAQYNRKLADILAVQEEIAREIAARLELRLTGEDQQRLAKRHTKDTETYQLYLRGRHHRNRGTEEEVRKGIEYFEKAIAKDRAFAPAHAGLADSHLIRGVAHTLPPAETFPRAAAAARKALEADPKVAEAHFVLGAVSTFYDWDWTAAERELRRAIELDPGSAPAHSWYAWYLTAREQHQEAMAEARRAQELDPLFAFSHVTAGIAYWNARQYDQTIDQCRKGLEVENQPWLHFLLGWTLVSKKMFAEAVGEFEKGRAGIGEDPGDEIAALGHAYGLWGKKDEARKMLRELEELAKRRYVPAIDRAFIYAGLGERDQAFQWLERAYAEHDPWLPWLRSPWFETLRLDPRFRDMVRRIGLEQ